MFLLISCSENLNDSEAQQAKDNLKLEKNQNDFIINEINLVFDNKINVESIESLENFGNTTLVSYKFDGGKLNNIGFVSLYDKTGKFIEEGGIRVYCTGNCDCGLEGVLDGDNSYLQCKCSSCVMHYVNTKSLSQSQKQQPIDFKQIAENSYLETFCKNAENINIDSFEVDKYENSDIYTLTYSSGAKKSTVMIVTNYSFDKVVLGDFIIDCTGSCDCRERFFPATGATECTCSPCQMKVTQLKAIE